MKCKFLCLQTFHGLFLFILIEWVTLLAFWHHFWSSWSFQSFHKKVFSWNQIPFARAYYQPYFSYSNLVKLYVDVIWHTFRPLFIIVSDMLVVIKNKLQISIIHCRNNINRIIYRLGIFFINWLTFHISTYSLLGNML